jgi:prepilin-type N-terminal cleavage/methylation domain-containing protein
VPEAVLVARAFTLVELLVVIAIIGLLVALGLPALGLVREHGSETVCKSNLRQMAMVMKTYTADFSGRFPEPRLIYHAGKSLSTEWITQYPPCCRWHDARIGLQSPLLTNERPELRGSLWSYLENFDIVKCRVGTRANTERSCNNACSFCEHEGRQPLYAEPHWPAQCDLSGKRYKGLVQPSTLGTIELGSLQIESTYGVEEGGLAQKSDYLLGDAFATYHRPKGGDLNTGHSYVVMLDGHVRKVTMPDQLRRSRQVPGLPESRLGPGGNLHLAWPIEIPPPGRWEGQ